VPAPPSATPPAADRSWAAFATQAPTLAAAVRARFAANLHHVLGTVRPDGSPRLSGTEVRIDDHRVTIGMMPASRKLADVQRDPRIELHSAPLEHDLAEGDAKLTGRLVPVPPPEADHPDGHFFEVALELVSLVRVADDELVVTTWRPGRGLRETRRR
jgi:hypothetical protein